MDADEVNYDMNSGSAFVIMLLSVLLSPRSPGAVAMRSWLQWSSLAFGIVIRGLSVGAIAGAYMSDAPLNDKEDQFERLWEGQTPKGYNRTKALKFRQYILEHVRQTQRPLTRENAKKYWMGELQKEMRDAELL